MCPLPSALGRHRGGVRVALEHRVDVGGLPELVVGMVGERTVDAVGGVVPRELPVAPELDALGRRCEPDPTSWVTIDEDVEGLDRRAEPLLDRLRVGVQRGEHEAPVRADGQLAETELAAIGRAVVAGEREPDEPAVVGVRPAVVRAGEPLGCTRRPRRRRRRGGGTG